MELSVGSKTELITSGFVILLTTFGALWEWLSQSEVFPMAGKLITFVLSTIYLYWVIRGRRAKVLKKEREYMQEDNNSPKEEG